MTVPERGALLALEDGTVFRGTSFGADGTVVGEACFNTGTTGYEEVLTDPSYHGQIVVMTATHVGNTGVTRRDRQSRRAWVAGFVVRAASPAFSSWRARGSLDEYLQSSGVPAISGVDTRKLTRHLRTRGAMMAALSTSITDPDELVDVARAAPAYTERDLVAEVTTARAYAWSATAESTEWRVVALDFGVKRNLLELLAGSGCAVTVVPASTPAQSVLESRPDGVFLSNGPGNPETAAYAIGTIRELLGRVPVFGICLGHQLLALALGARTTKLPFGHHGSNHPVRRAGRARIEITSQNHGFAAAESSFAGTGARVSHVNLNDGTVEGFEVPGVAFGVQYHPEAGPGPHDSRYLFAAFTELMSASAGARPRAASA